MLLRGCGDLFDLATHVPRLTLLDHRVNLTTLGLLLLHRFAGRAHTA